MNAVQVFQNSKFGEVRVTTTETGEPMFAGVDVARALGYENPNKAVVDHCKSGNITKQYTPHPNGIGGVYIMYIRENDVYRLIMRSKLPSAEKFQDWVCEEVLPTIRKHGAYMSPDIVEQALLNPDTLIQLANTIKEERRQKEILQLQTQKQKEVIKEMVPKVEYHDEVLQTQNVFPITVIAKELGMSGQALNNRLNMMRIIYKMGATWVLYHKYQNLGLTKTKTVTYTDQDGQTKTAINTYWTQKGRSFIHDQIKRKKEVIENGLQ
jgi:prophage antirepressor-like protein